MQVFFENLSLTEFQVRYLVLYLLFSVIDGFEWFWMGSLENIKLYARFPQGSILVPTLFVLYINDLLDVVCNIGIYADGTTLYSKCGQASDL